MNDIKSYNKKLIFRLLVLIIIVSLLLTGCMAGRGNFKPMKPAGFFSGIWHGWLAPFSLIMSFFNPRIKMYEVINTGFPYELGFYMAIVGGFGSIALARKNKNKY